MRDKGINMTTKHRVIILQDQLTICRLHKDDAFPSWASNHHFVCIARTVEELSIIAPEAVVPAHLLQDKGWRCVKVEGPLELTLSGVLAALISPLARAEISVLAVATYDTDYFLVKEVHLNQAISILREEGYDVSVDG